MCVRACITPSHSHALTLCLSHTKHPLRTTDKGPGQERMIYTEIFLYLHTQTHQDRGDRPALRTTGKGPGQERMIYTVNFLYLHAQTHEDRGDRPALRTTGTGLYRTDHIPFSTNNTSNSTNNISYSTNITSCSTDNTSCSTNVQRIQYKEYII